MPDKKISIRFGKKDKDILNHLTKLAEKDFGQYSTAIKEILRSHAKLEKSKRELI